MYYTLLTLFSNKFGDGSIWPRTCCIVSICSRVNRPFSLRVYQTVDSLVCYLYNLFWGDEITKLIEPDEKGDPMSPLKWISKSTYKINDALTEKKIKVSQVF